MTDKPLTMKEFYAEFGNEPYKIVLISKIDQMETMYTKYDGKPEREWVRKTDVIKLIREE